MSREELLKEKQPEILGLAAKYGARNVRVFGSVARGKADERTDVDFLVEMDPEDRSWISAVCRRNSRLC
jgi:uncharacterized protein